MAGDPRESRAATVATTVTDVLVYVVVLGLATQYAPQILSETFSDVLVTAVLLKAVLEVVLLIKGAVVRRIRAAHRLLGRVIGLLVLWLVLASSKLLVLETVDLVLGGRVSLGGFWSVTGLVVVLMLSRSAVHLGVRAALDPGSTSAPARGTPSPPRIPRATAPPPPAAEPGAGSDHGRRHEAGSRPHLTPGGRAGTGSGAPGCPAWTPWEERT